MNIRPLPLRNSPAVPMQKRELPVPYSQDYYTASLSVSDEIIDCVEIQFSNYQPALSRQTPYPILSNRPAQSKGTLIDLWI
ncbi:MAG: hypothetical protein NTZ57_08015 [Deltaproteobacteria bacterium]|nr:hypothetical protein [Deltaproteobacteria bacterium]